MTGTETVLLVETLYYDFIDRHATLWLRYGLWLYIQYA
jgi:hypothetical protein